MKRLFAILSTGNLVCAALLLCQWFSHAVAANIVALVAGVLCLAAGLVCVAAWHEED